MIENKLYKEDIQYIAQSNLQWNKLHNKKLLITGASGLIGECFVDVIMYKNQSDKLNCKVYAVGRNLEKAKQIFGSYMGSEWFEFVSHDINIPMYMKNAVKKEETEIIDYVLHLASNTHPVAYATEPINTIASNVIGTYNMLEFAVLHQTSRFLFASSCEIYGENRGDEQFFDEKYCGYIDCNTLRAGYPESKRCGETLCQAYKEQKNLDVVIPRLARSYGPTMLKSDTKAISQFIKKGVAGENIVLKSEGTQYYSYTYIADVVAGLFVVLLTGKNGEAYNIADERSDIMLKDLAYIIAEATGGKVVFELPDEVEKAGYSRATKARLCGNKIKQLGWTPRYDIYHGIVRTLQILKEMV